MMWARSVAILTFGAVPALAQSLVEALVANGFGKYAELVRDSDIANAGPNLIVYAPANGSLSGPDYGTSNGTTLSRRATDKQIGKATIAQQTVTDTTVTFPPPETKRRFARASNNGDDDDDNEAAVPVGSTFMTLLDDPEFINLGPGINQTVVEKFVASSDLLVVFTGLGATVKVFGHDIPSDNGVIRPITGTFTLPGTISETLPFLGVDAFQRLLEQNASLKAEIEGRPRITVLAPDDNAFEAAGVKHATRRDHDHDYRLDLIRRHIIVDFLAYSTLLKDGQRFPTLAGTVVTVSVRDDAIYLDDARILSSDANTANGAIHVIGKVTFRPLTVVLQGGRANNRGFFARFSPDRRRCRP